jgi:alanine-synthesizing transaminase
MTEIEPAKRTEHITYAIRDVVVEAKKLQKEGAKILFLNIGDPCVYDFSTPKHMIEAVNKSMLENRNGYADSHGLEEARSAIVNENRKYGFESSPENVLISTGVSEGIDMALASLVNPGDNLLTPRPSYPVYLAVMHKIGGVLNEYMTDEENGWQPDIEDIKKRINSKTKGIVLINPNNPTGALYDEKTLKEILSIAREHNLVVFADEIYNKILLDDDKFFSLASLDEEIPIVTFNGLAKNYLVPGWRIGWMTFTGSGIDKYREAVFKIARSRLCSPTNQQYAVKPALEGPQEFLRDVIGKLRKRRDVVFKRLNEEGFHCTKPKGAFYAFPGMDYAVTDDKEFVMDLLHKKHILVVHGSGFGWKNPDHFRVVFLPDENILNDAFDRLHDYVKERF